MIFFINQQQYFTTKGGAHVLPCTGTQKAESLANESRMVEMTHLAQTSDFSETVLMLTKNK